MDLPLIAQKNYEAVFKLTNGDLPDSIMNGLSSSRSGREMTFRKAELSGKLR